MADNTAYLEETRAPMLYGVTFSLLGTAIIVCCFRLYCRIFMVKAIQVSDYLMAIATVVTIGMCVMIHRQIQTGMGRHVEYSRARPEMWSVSMKVGYAQNILYQSSLGIIKTSILMQYYRIAATTLQRRVILGVLAFVVVFCTFVTLSAILQCIPISAAFDVATFPKGCWNMMAMNFFTSSVNTLTDIVILILPIPLLIKMNMQRTKKVILFLVLSSGMISVASALVRLSNIVLWNDAADSTYNGSVIPMWDAVEVCVGITSASIPALQPMFKWLVKQGSSHMSSERTRNRTDIRLDSVSKGELQSVTWQQALYGAGTSSKAGTSLEEGFIGEDDQAPICK
ncbi:hypothetical protein BKA61DRAFT_669696 [Leptodontidium sp. MPI-SDFR-AT-0119]|nr:hypothetical protein BKA61DRAFT_669696 [Leptodontidium sp. MPI-SDFR-AT-0119]